MTEADDILKRIKRARFELVPAVLSTALEPFGLAMDVRSKTEEVGIADLRLLTAPGEGPGERVGFAGWHLSDHLAIGVYETDRIWLRKPIWLTFKGASSLQIYDRLNTVIIKRLRPQATRVRKASPGGKSREMLCIHTAHDDPITWHTFQSSNELGGTEAWRCGACGHNTVIPRGP